MRARNTRTPPKNSGIQPQKIEFREPPESLLAAFVYIEKEFVEAGADGVRGYSATAYYADVRMMLLELVGTMLSNIPAAFGVVMDAVLKFNIPLTQLIPILLAPPQFRREAAKNGADDGVARLIYETCRLNGLLRVLMRICMQDDKLPSGGELVAGDVVAVLTGVAAFDPVIEQPWRLSLYPFLPGPERDIDNYLMFGERRIDNPDGRGCWGRDRLALPMLKECVKAAGRLQHLQRVAGKAGHARTLTNVTIGLSARYSGVLPDWPPAPPTACPVAHPA